MGKVKIVFDDKVTDGNMMARCVNYADQYLMVMDKILDDDEFYKDYFIDIRPATKKVIKIVKHRFTEEGKKDNASVMITFNPLDLYLFFFSVKTYLDTQIDIYKDKGRFTFNYKYDEVLSDKEYSEGQIEKLKNMLDEICEKENKG